MALSVNRIYDVSESGQLVPEVGVSSRTRRSTQVTCNLVRARNTHRAQGWRRRVGGKGEGRGRANGPRRARYYCSGQDRVSVTPFGAIMPKVYSAFNWRRLVVGRGTLKKRLGSSVSGAGVTGAGVTGAGVTVIPSR